MRRWLSLLLVLLAVSVPWTAALAQEQRVYDMAGLYSADEVETLEAHLAEAREELGTDIVIATTDDAQGKSAKLYAADFYDEMGFGRGSDHSGVILLIDMENREAAVVTTGGMIDVLTDQRIEDILDDVFEGLGDGDFMLAAENYIRALERWVPQGVPEDHYRYDTETGEITVPKIHFLSAAEVAVAAVLALAAGSLSCLFVYRRYKMKAGGRDRYDYRDRTVMQLSANDDRFLGRAVTTRYIPPPPPSNGGGSGGGFSSSGGSSTFSGSSGTSHGGGSRSF